MKRSGSRLLFPLVILVVLGFSACQELGVGPNVLAKPGGGSAATTSPGGSGLTSAEAAGGLKEALTVGSGKAVASVGKTDGYFQNALIRILLPPEVRQYESALRMAGLGSQVDAFVLSMNRAAERAAPQAKTLLWDAIKQMSFADVWRILRGRENEATLYFKEKTEGRLSDLFRPIVHQAMGEVGVTNQYQRLSGQLGALSLGRFQAPDLDRYVTGKALDGLFLMLAEEEKDIRRNPAARVTSLLQKVFGSK